MNSLTCLLCRWNAARCLDDGGTPAGWTAGHLSRCARCHAAYERERGIAARLMIKSSDSTAPKLPPFFHERILANLDLRRTPPATGFRMGGWASAMCGAVAVLVVVVALENRKDPRNISSGAPSEGVHSVGSRFAGLAGFSGGQAVRALDAKLDGPLEGELRFVMDDARTALNALSKSFLPAEPR